MAKVVCYSGGRRSWITCSDPSCLTIGAHYEVEKEIDKGWQTNYVLKGIEGEFNSTWFKVVAVDKVYMAVAKETPKKGKRYQCYRIDMIEGNPRLVSCNTSDVVSISNMGNNIYTVMTASGSTYIVKVSA